MYEQQGGRSLQASGERKKMPSILSLDAYYQNRNKKGSFYLVLPSFYLVLPIFFLVLPSFYLVLPGFT